MATRSFWRSTTLHSLWHVCPREASSAECPSYSPQARSGAERLQVELDLTRADLSELIADFAVVELYLEHELPSMVRMFRRERSARKGPGGVGQAMLS
eukprot:12416917-Alexandrium_andersonii.AAC.1